MTQVSAISSSNEKAAQLAADHLEIDSLLGLAEIKVRYLKRLHFLHAKDSYGEGEVSAAMALLPTEDTAGVSLDSLKESVLCQSGMYQAVPLASSYLVVSKANAQAAKRAMIDNWAYNKEVQRDVSQRFAASKVSRCQLGVELHKEWLKDMVKTCGKKCLLINDFHHGSAEVMKACMDVKVSDEATAQGVRLCAWSRDPRSVFLKPMAHVFEEKTDFGWASARGGSRRKAQKVQENVASSHDSAYESVEFVSRWRLDHP